MRGALTHLELEAFHSAAVIAFEQAVSRQGRYLLTTTIAGIPICIETAGNELMLAIRPALSGIIATRATTGASRILVYDIEASGISAPQFDRPIQHLIRWRGDCWTESTTPFRLVIHLYEKTLEVFDPASGICIVMISSVEKLPYWSLAAPLRTPLSMILESRGVYLVHGAAMGGADGALLLTGYGGSGKSTATLTCHKVGMPIMGDDYVAIRPSSTEGAHPTVHHVFASLKLMPQELGEDVAGSSSAKKQIIYPFGCGTEGLLRDAPLLAVASARVGKSTQTETYDAASEEVARIAYASTSLQIPMANEDLYAASILGCARQTRAYRMEFGSDRTHAPLAIKNLLSEDHDRPKCSRIPVWARDGALEPISVVIPVYNAAEFIEEAIASVVEQNYPDSEIIIVDDGSTDDLPSALARIQVPFKLIRQQKTGPAAARNAGLRESNGSWIAFLDADDMWAPMALKTMGRDLALHETAGVIHGTAVTFTKDPCKDAYINAYNPRENYPFYIGGGLYRRRAFDVAGHFDETLMHGEDTDWFLRATESGVPIVKISEAVLRVRMHDANMTADKEAVKRGQMQVLHRRILRDRRAQ